MSFGDKPEIEIHDGEHRYIIRSTGGSSQKYGKCEVCGKHVTEVYHQVEERKYPYGWTRHGCHDLFGHKECLLGIRKD